LAAGSKLFPEHDEIKINNIVYTRIPYEFLIYNTEHRIRVYVHTIEFYSGLQYSLLILD
jgi:hypothetical protein